MFALVNEAGVMVDSSSTQRLLLLYYGNTVCDDGFSDNSAAAICKEMGYAGAISWTNGELHGIQHELQIGLGDVICSDDSWESCTSTTSHECDHSEDVHLTCDVQGKSRFISDRISWLIHQLLFQTKNKVGTYIW